MRHLRWSQLAYLVRRRVLRPSNLRRWKDAKVALKDLQKPPIFWEWQPHIARQIISKGQVCFLEFSISESAGPAWAVRELSRIGLYEINYCDFLNIDLTAPED